MFESILDYRTKVLLLILLKNDTDLLNECGFLKSDTNCPCKKYKNFLMEQNAEYLEYIKNEEKAIIEKSLNK